MSVEPPPPDWVRSDTAFHHRRSILDGERARRTRSSPRVALELAPRGAILDEAERSPCDGGYGPIEARGDTAASFGTELMDEIRREWEDLAFTTLRRTQLVAFLGFVVVLALTLYGWQRGIFSSMAADLSGERVVADGTPSAPRLSSDQVAWTDEVDDDGRRSTASFASDRAFAGQTDDDEPTSGAKLFVADGKNASKRGSTQPVQGGSTAATGEGPARSAETGAGSAETSDRSSTARKQTAITAAPVRYEDCAQAAAAGAAPISLGEPGYRLSLDADKDGVACENGSTPEDPGDGPVDSLYSNPTPTASPQASGSTTSVSSTGAGTTSPADPTTTSPNSTSGSSTTTTGSTESSGATSASTTTTTSATTSTTEATSSTVSTTATTSTTTVSTTTTMSTTSTTTTTSPTSTSAPSTTTTGSTTIELPPIDPIRLGRPG